MHFWASNIESSENSPLKVLLPSLRGFNALEWNERVYFSRSWHVTPAEHARHVTSAVCLRCMPAVMAYWEMQLFSCFLIRPWIRTLIRSLHFLYRKSLNSLNRFSSIFSFIYTWYMNLLFILNIKTLGSLFSGGCTGNFSYYRLWSNTSHSVPSCVASVSNYVNSYQYDPYTHPSFLANRQQRYICIIEI